ncbi:hypothetical protein DYB36_009253 [Aphanomyces astaci]|uniref:Uncharacterized protein n=1 Tax=Aphanomyces astaci TaxID=112090 RepID=A0A397AYE6_APHAT|nr:hypothetical protein DYB36_009253 [Aphanomyces astaci]
MMLDQLAATMPRSSHGYDEYKFREEFLPPDLVIVIADMESFINRINPEEQYSGDLGFLSTPCIPRSRLCMWIREYGVAGIARVYMHRPYLLNEDFVIYFAYTGRVDILQFLHDKSMYLSTFAMVAAAARGHLDVVMFLCDVSYWHELARVRASYQGHVDIVEYLETYEFMHNLSNEFTCVLQPI